MELLYQKTALVSQKELQKTAVKLVPYIQKLRRVLKEDKYTVPESSINLPSDKKQLREVLEMKKKMVSRKLKYIIVIGIGGSNLGTKAVYDAMYSYSDVLAPRRFPKMFFADTTDPEFLQALCRFIELEIKHPEEVMMNIVTKSGTTIETVTNLEIILVAFRKKIKEIEKRIVVTTDRGSKLWKAAAGKKIKLLAVQPVVGGRYSIFSSVGLFPLAACGFNVSEFCAGAVKMGGKCLNSQPLKNPAAVSASLLFLNLKNCKVINDNFLFSPELESAGKWYRQLMGESMGKEKDLDGKTVHAGITPTVSIGSTDLHSVGQLYLGGPADKFTSFIYSSKISSKIKLPEKFFFPGLVNELKGKTAGEIMDAILRGVKIAYSNKKLPYMEIVLDGISLHSLGEWFQYKMLEIMYLGMLMNVNPFDQPNVEAYKKETRRILLSR